MKLIITEKPSVGQAYAKVLGVRDRHDGYLEGGGYIVSWCVGHLVELLEPEEYDGRYSKWEYADLPIIPEGKAYIQVNKELQRVSRDTLTNPEMAALLKTLAKSL